MKLSELLSKIAFPGFVALVELDEHGNEFESFGSYDLSKELDEIPADLMGRKVDSIWPSRQPDGWPLVKIQLI